MSCRRKYLDWSRQWLVVAAFVNEREKKIARDSREFPADGSWSSLHCREDQV